MLKKIKWSKLAIFVLIPLAVGALAGFITMGGMDSYNTLNKPALSPPGWVFPVVWTILYTLMGISSYIVYNAQKSMSRAQGLKTYALQLAVNFIWPIIFFNAQNYFLAFIVLIVLWLLVLRMILLFKNVSPLAAYLQLPYLAWLTFAAYLNLAVLLLNR